MDADGNPIREYLLVRREDGPWFFPGGKVLKGETLEETLKREIEEETGLKAGVDYPDQFDFEKSTSGAYESEGKEYAIANVTFPTDSLKKEPRPQPNDRIKKVMWAADPLSYDLTPQVRAVLEAKMGIIRPLGRNEIKNIADDDIED
ncbi:NUDIX domain-containing protein [Candidatus Kaiserbacteria bacterium]|nr:NUDIX domain-containing protein [Candidatus Kaiserbacteria bacterium]